MSCPRLIPSQIHEKMEALKHIGIDVLEMLEQCPPPLPKASRVTRRRGRGRRHGGAMLTREHVKTAIYVLIVGLACSITSMAIYSENPSKRMVADGIKAVMNGTCRSMTATIPWYSMGWENPVCTQWKAVLALVEEALRKVITLDSTSLFRLISVLAGLIFAPFLRYKEMTREVNLLADKIMEQIAHTTAAADDANAIEDEGSITSSVQQQRRLQNGLSDSLRITNRRTNRRTDTPTPPPPPPTPPPPSPPSVPTLFQHFGDEDKSRRASKRSRSSRKK